VIGRFAWAALAAILAPGGNPAQAEEMIYGLAQDAVCRDKSGKIIEPRVVLNVTAAAPLPAEAGPYDLVKVKDKDCYFHRVETILEPTPSSCTIASVNGPNAAVAGVRDTPNCSDK